MKNICKLMLILGILPSAYAMRGEEREAKYPKVISLKRKGKYEEKKGPSTAKIFRPEELSPLSSKKYTALTFSEFIEEVIVRVLPSKEEDTKKELTMQMQDLLKAKSDGQPTVHHFSPPLERTRSVESLDSERTESIVGTPRVLDSTPESSLDCFNFGNQNFLAQRAISIDETALPKLEDFMSQSSTKEGEKFRLLLVGSTDPLLSYSSTVGNVMSKTVGEDSENDPIF